MSKQYPYAARDPISAMRLAKRLPPGAAIDGDPLYLAKLRKQHGWKYEFWALMDQKGH